MDVVSSLPALQHVRRPASEAAASAHDQRLLKTAKEFEAVFLAQMLNATALGREPAGFGGGFGSEAFRSLLTEEYARRIAERGGLGIAESVYRQLSEYAR